MITSTMYSVSQAPSKEHRNLTRLADAAAESNQSPNSFRFVRMNRSGHQGVAVDNVVSIAGGRGAAPGRFAALCMASMNRLEGVVRDAWCGLSRQPSAISELGGMSKCSFMALHRMITALLVTARHPPFVSTSANPSVPWAPMRFLPHHLPTSGWSGAPAPHS